MANKPFGREKNVTGAGKGVHKRGDGLGTGQVGKGGRPGGSGSGGSQQGFSGGQGGQRGTSGGQRSSSSMGKSPIIIIIALVAALFGGGGSALGLFGGSGSSSSGSSYSSGTTTHTSSGSSSSLTSASSLSSLGSLFSGLTGSSSAVSTGWSSEENTAQLDTSVASGARAKYTTIKGNGADTVTILVYMCGTDLESRSSMATRDLQEMAAATLSDNVNIIVYTGGCSGWRTSGISNSVHQIYKVESGSLKRLESDMGSASMTNPNTLAEFLKYGKKNYSADRMMLIFWDHGGGSLSGYGYDELNPRSGSMSLANIDKALTAGGIKFDFIGFDACLMATTETAVMVADHADYLIGSEETEPGIGWYYTDWLTKLSKNTSMPTIEIGKNIVDDFVTMCNKQCRGQQTTLSVVDVAELSSTLGDDLKAFSESTKALITGDDYKTVSTARNNTREFASSSKIDQIDMVHFAKNLGTKEGEALAETLLSAIKYNRTSSNMTNAYGLSAYFPLRKASSVNTAVATMDAIGMDSSYADCIREFASLEVSGQAASGGTGLDLGSFLTGGSSNAGTSSSSSDIFGLLESFMGGSGSSSNAFSFLSGRSLSTEDTAEYIAANNFDVSALVWDESDGTKKMKLSDEQWQLVESLELSVYFDDGEGYIDLGLDNVFELTDDGALVGEFDNTWLSINDQPVAYYHADTTVDGDEYTVTGRVPALLNGERVELVILFTQDEPNGFIAGADPDYDEDVTETKARGLIELEEGDTLDFLCDYYSYDGTYSDSYYLGEQMTVTGDLVISNTDLGDDGASAMYKFTDIYQQSYWTPAM